MLSVLAVMLGCSNENTVEEPKDNGAPITVAAARFSSKILFGGAVGKVDLKSGKMTFSKDQKSILKVFNSLIKKSNIDANLTRLEFKQLRDVYYLKGYGDDYKSTMLLVSDGSGNLESSGTTCTTKACATTSGCEVTTAGHCSACSGDCTKSTTVNY